MSTMKPGLFHCGRCGRFFEAAVGIAAVRRCPECGGDPVVASGERRRTGLPEAGRSVVRDLPANPAAQREPAAQPMPAGRGPSSRSGRVRHSGSHRHSNPATRKVVILVGFWVAALAVVALMMRQRGNPGDERPAGKAAAGAAGAGGVVDPLAASEDHRERELLTVAYPEYGNALAEFLQSASPEVRSQWICEPLRLTAPMARFYQSNTTYLPEEMPEQVFSGVIQSASGLLIESLWKDASGRRIEAVFRREQGQWRLDWESFVHFSETPWVMFLAGAGSDLQEFRLLARERLAEERRMKPTVSLVFHPPRFGSPSEPGPASQEFLVDRASGPGRKIEALLRLRREGGTPLGARIPSQDPAEMIRVRVLVRRVEDERFGSRFKVEDVLAGHWLGIAQSGIPGDGEEADEAASGGP